jgi:hypothetical protein
MIVKFSIFFHLELGDFAVTVDDQKEAFSRAYVKAVASVAGYATSEQVPDKTSIDITFHSQKGRCVPIEAQLKASSREDIISEKMIHFPLKIKNYNDLHADSYCPRILIILLLPCGFDECPAKWINQSADSLALMKCAYWQRLTGMSDTANTESVTVKIPMDDEHIFKPEVLDIIAKQVSSTIAEV